MPVHDWSKVVAGTFHDFHQAWIIEIRNTLNRGLLPEGFYAMAEQVARGPIPDVVTLESAHNGDDPKRWDFSGSSTVMTVAANPPRVKHREQAEVDVYAAKADRIAVRSANGDRVVAVIEIVSPESKNSEAAVSKFIRKLAEELENGCHFVIVDLHRPHANDPRGLHARFWEYLHGESCGVDLEQPFGVSSYCADIVPTAYFEPVGLNEPLPNMPLFLTTNHYVEIPLERTYMTAWNDLPRRWREVIETRS